MRILHLDQIEILFPVRPLFLPAAWRSSTPRPTSRSRRAGGARTPCCADIRRRRSTRRRACRVRWRRRAPVRVRPSPVPSPDSACPHSTSHRSERGDAVFLSSKSGSAPCAFAVRHERRYHLVASCNVHRTEKRTVVIGLRPAALPSARALLALRRAAGTAERPGNRRSSIRICTRSSSARRSGRFR